MVFIFIISKGYVIIVVLSFVIVLSKKYCNIESRNEFV